MPSPVAPASPPTYVVVNSQGNNALTVAPQQAAGPLMQVVITGSGAGYTAGVTYNVALSGGTGTGAQAAVVVTGTVVTGVTITNNGSGYTVGDSLTVPGGTTAATVVVSYLPTSSVSTLELSGVNALNWGSNVWESLYRLTENFAAPTAPGSNAVLGGTNVSPLVGQLWYNTTGQTLNFWNGTAWTALAAGSDVTSITATAPITANGVSGTGEIGAVTLAITTFSPSASGIVPASGGGTLNFLRADGTWVAPPNSGGTITSLAATGSTGLVIGGSPITSSGTLTFTLGTELQGLAGLSMLGLFKRTGAGTYAAAVASDISSTLGYTPYNASNPSGFITSAATITLTGNVTGSGSTTNIPTTIANSVVTNAKLAVAPPSTIKGNNTGAYTNPTDLSGGQVAAMLPIFSAGANGVVPASGGGTTNFLRADGSWAAPTGGGYFLSPNGYYTMPGGFIIQWGSFNFPGSGTTTVYFPTAFPSACFSVTTTQPNNVSYGYAVPVLDVTNSYFQFGNAPSVSQTIWWMAVGH